jgi:hypothetical protein
MLCLLRYRLEGMLTIRYFASYELIKRSLSPAAPTLPNGEKAAAPPLSIGAVMLAGGSAGVAMWSVAIPPDVSQASSQGRGRGADIRPRLSNPDSNLLLRAHTLVSLIVLGN